MTERAATYREVFADREFRALFGAQLLSVVGDQFARVALAVLVWNRTSSATLTALTYALTFLPSIIAGPVLGGLADRYPRRSVMILTDLLRAVLLAAMAIPGMPLVIMCVLLVAVQMLAAPFEAARAGVVLAVFDREADPRFPVANAISNVTHQAGQLLGFAAAGLIIVGVSTSGALLLDAATFVVSAALLAAGVRHRPAADAGGDTGLAGWAARVSGGWTLVTRDRRLRWITLVLCIPAFPVVVEGLAVPYAAELQVTTVAIGLLFAAEPAGSVLGMLLISKAPHRRQLSLLLPLAVTSSAVLVVCALRPGLLITVLLWFASGVASAYFVTANTELGWVTPDAQRGQVYGFVGSVMRASQGLGVLGAGVVADVIPPALAIAAAGAVGTLFAATVCLGYLRERSTASATTSTSPATAADPPE